MTDLLKLVFHHDQRKEQLVPSSKDNESPLAMFSAPDPTFSTLYFSGTVLEEMKFGLSGLKRYEEIISIIEQAFDVEDLQSIIEPLENGKSVLIDRKSKKITEDDHAEGVKLWSALDKEGIVLFKRENKDGFDLQLFSKDNIYLLFFYPLQAMLGEDFRCFSINGKRVHNEEMFFFETHRLNKPPHGFEEILPESVL